MDKYFYIIEQDECGNRYLHLEGNIYYNDADDSDTCYRVAEWTFLYLTIEEAMAMLNDDTFFDYANERVAYLKDVTEQQAKDMCEDFFDGQPGTKLHIKDINDSTPCGCYWFEGETSIEYNFKVDGDKFRCRVCGDEVGWRFAGDQWILSSDSEGDEGKGICHSCLVEHCCNTNCFGCDWYKYPNCPHIETKKIYMEED